MKQWAEVRLSGQALDPTPRNVGPDLWNTVTDVVFRDGAAQPTRGQFVPFSTNYTGSGHYLHDVALAKRSVTAAEPVSLVFFTESTSYKYPPFAPILKRLNYAGGYEATITPTDWIGNEFFQGRPTGGILNGCVVWNYDGWLEDSLGSPSGCFPAYYDCNAATLAGAASVLPGWSTSWPTAWTARSVRPFGNFLVAMFKRVWTDESTVTPYPHTVFWSDAAAGGIPSTWTASSTNMAGETELEPHGGSLIDGYPLGNDFILFKEQASYRMSYVGGTGVFAFSRLNADRGMRTQGAATNIEGRLVVADAAGVYALSPDGSTEELMTDTVRRAYTLQAVKNGTGVRTQIAYSTLRNELLVAMSYGLYPIDMAWVLDLATGKWGHADLTFDGTYNGWVNMKEFLGQELNSSPGSPFLDRNPWFIGNGTDDDCVFIWQGSKNFPSAGIPSGTASLTKYALDLGDPVNYKLAHRIRLIVEAAAGEVFTVSVTGKDSPAGTTVSSASATWTAGTTRDIGLSVQGRFFDVTITNAPSNLTQWKLSGFDIEFSKAGAW